MRLRKASRGISDNEFINSKLVELLQIAIDLFDLIRLLLLLIGNWQEVRIDILICRLHALLKEKAFGVDGADACVASLAQYPPSRPWMKLP